MPISLGSKVLVHGTRGTVVWIAPAGIANLDEVTVLFAERLDTYLSDEVQLAPLWDRTWQEQALEKFGQAEIVHCCEGTFYG